MPVYFFDTRALVKRYHMVCVPFCPNMWKFSNEAYA